MKHSVVYLLFLLLISACFLFSHTAKCEEEQQGIPSANAGNPFARNFGDRKDKARLSTCMGSCLAQYPGVKDFVMKESMGYVGLQVMFLGDKPTIKFYDRSQQETEEIDISSMSAGEIRELLAKHGVESRK